MASYVAAGISELRRQRNDTKTHAQDCLIVVIWIGVISYMKQYVITVRENGGGLMILRQRVLYTSNCFRFIARLHPQSPSHFAWWPSARVTQNLRFSYISHAIFFIGAAAQRGPWPPHSWGFLITHNDASQSVWLLWTSDQLVAETSAWQHTTLTTDKHPCPRWDSNPRSQQASGRRPTP